MGSQGATKTQGGLAALFWLDPQKMAWAPEPWFSGPNSGCPLGLVLKYMLHPPPRPPPPLPPPRRPKEKEVGFSFGFPFGFPGAGTPPKTRQKKRRLLDPWREGELWEDCGLSQQPTTMEPRPRRFDRLDLAVAQKTGTKLEPDR